MDRTWEQIAEDTDHRGRRAFLLAGAVLTVAIGSAALLAGMAPAMTESPQRAQDPAAGNPDRATRLASER